MASAAQLRRRLVQEAGFGAHMASVAGCALPTPHRGVDESGLRAGEVVGQVLVAAGAKISSRVSQELGITRGVRVVTRAALAVQDRRVGLPPRRGFDLVVTGEAEIGFGFHEANPPAGRRWSTGCGS